MSEERDEKPRIGLDDLAPLVQELAAPREIPALVGRFLDLVKAWATPSAVVAAVREPGAGAGWRLLPALSLGSIPLGIERTFNSLVEDTPSCLTRPTIFRPKDEVPGVKPRDNCVVPWSFEGEQGLLLIRGVPRPYPANLGEALAIAAAPLWPRLLGGPASRIETLVAEVARLSQSLQHEASRQLERLQAARPPQPSAEDDAASLARIATLEGELQAAREEAQRASRARAELAERLAGFEAAAELNRSERDSARAELKRLAEQMAASESQRAAAPSEAVAAQARAAQEALGAAQRELAALRSQGDPRELGERLAHLEAALETTRSERDRARVECERLSARIEPLQSERAAAEGRGRELQRAAEAAEAKAQGLEARAQAAEARAKAVEDGLAAAQRAATQARSESERSEQRTKDQAERWEGSLSALRSALTALRRAAFVPPGLRLALEDTAALVDSDPERKAPWLRVALLDRDPVALEELAAELEATGVEMRIANYPEELGLLLRTPGARDLAAIICDVMAFRADQNVAGLFRSWEKDRPGIAYYLSYNPDSSGETDRARRIPQSLTAGHLVRPLVKARLVEALEVLARKRTQAAP